MALVRLRLTALLLALTLALLLGLMVLHQWYTSRQAFVSELRIQAAIVGAQAGAALLFDDSVGAHEILAALHHSSILVEAALFRPDGTVLARWQAENTTLVAASDTTTLLQPVEFRERTVGSIFLRARLDALSADLLRFVFSFLLMTLTAILLALPLSQRLRRRASEAEALFDGFFDASPFGMAIVDAQGHCLRLNHTLAGTLGQPARRLIGRRLIDALPAGDGDPWRKAMNEALHGLTAVGEWSAPLAGERRDFLLLAFPIAARRSGACGVVVVDISERKRDQRELEDSRRLLCQLAHRREQLIDAEHKRLAIEIHDELGQVLTAALLRLRLLRRLLPAEGEAVTASGEIEELLREAQAGMRAIATRLRPAVLGFGLAPALEWLSERLMKDSGIDCRLQLPPTLPPLDEETALACFRIVQEALHNCLKHSGASEVEVLVGHDGHTLRLSVRDNGRGLPTEETNEGIRFGLIGMRERAENIGGTLTVTGPPGQGVTVTLILPLPATQVAPTEESFR